jgi:hypothetical protein
MHGRAGLIRLIVLSVGWCLAGSAIADDDDYPSWQPANDPAITTTGPIVMLPDRLHAGQADFPWQEAGVIAQFKPDQGPIPARVFAVDAPDNPVLLNGKTLCGEKSVTWIVMVPEPPGGLEIDAYSVTDKPTSISSPGLCGAFAYRRWAG